MRSRVFLDTSFAIALASSTDTCHRRSLELADTVAMENIRMVTTQAILLEIGNALSKRRHRQVGARLLTSLTSDPRVDILALDGELMASGFALYCERLDKEWGLTDCISFAAMRLAGIDEALTADHHFRQAGFHALLLESP